MSRNDVLLRSDAAHFDHIRDEPVLPVDIQRNLGLIDEAHTASLRLKDEVIEEHYQVLLAR